jgi:hypothetical protein
MDLLRDPKPWNGQRIATRYLLSNELIPACGCPGITLSEKENRIGRIERPNFGQMKRTLMSHNKTESADRSFRRSADAPHSLTGQGSRFVGTLIAL